METNIYKKLFEVKKAGIKLQRDTKAFNYKYATLSQIQDKFSDVLQEQWLLVFHYIRDNTVVTTIVDTQYINSNWDEWMDSISSEIQLSENTKPQDKWSEITYYRRYNLLSLLDLEVEDDDWKKAQESKPEVKEEKKWLNYESFKEIVEAGNTDKISIWKVITEDWFSLSNNAKTAITHYLETWIVAKDLFFNKK